MTETYNLTMNYTSIAEAGRDVVSHAAWLPNLLLLFEFLLIALIGAGISKKNTGISNIAMWMTIAGLVTSTSAFMVYAVGGLLTIETVAISITVTMIGALWYFTMPDNDNF